MLVKISSNSNPGEDSIGTELEEVPGGVDGVVDGVDDDDGGTVIVGVALTSLDAGPSPTEFSDLTT